MKPSRSLLELAGVVLFRFPPVVRAWAILLVCVNAAALLIVHTIHGQVVLAAAVAGIAVMMLIHARLGFVRLLGIGHVFWPPMIVWLAMNLPEPTEHPARYYWLVAVIVCNSISLVIDAADVFRFLAGERAPYHHWRRHEDLQ